MKMNSNIKKIAVLGAGQIGRTIAIDLSRNGHKVSCYDINLNCLNLLSEYDTINKNQVNLLSLNYDTTFESYDLIVSAVPGFMGYRVLESIILAKKDCVDISFFSENYEALAQLAIENEVRVVVDCGIAPGMSNLILGRESENLNIKNYKVSVGGLPQEKIYPFEYKAPYSPLDVIEFYSRPVRLRENGVDVIKKPLSNIEELFIPGVGELEAFDTDGLRTLLTSFPDIDNMSEKTIRYPGHADKIQLLKDMGFFKEENIENTIKVLVEEWRINPTDKDITIMVANIEGLDEFGDDVKISYSLIDKHDGKFHSMSRTTAYTCVAVSELLLNEQINEIGINLPEDIGKSKESFDFILNYLKQRNVNFIKKVI